MISGFNTDVECAGTTYHVQTEDKGAPHHVIMSLVYNKGTILASRREPYDTDIPEKQLKDRLDKQHKLICAAVKAGRIDDLKQMTAAKRNGAAAGNVKRVAEPLSAPAEVAVAQQAIPEVQIPVPELPISISPPLPPMAPERVTRAPITAEIPLPLVLDPFAQAPIIEAVEIVEEYPEILPAEVVEVVSELSGQSRPTHNKLGIELLGDGKFRGGDRKTVNLMICRGSDRKVVPGAQIMVKILGSAFRPVIFHARSDQNGLAKVHLQVPQFTAGRAALLVRAIANGEEVELRRIVTANS